MKRLNLRAYYKRIHIGRRTFKTVLAVLISLIIVSSYGATTNKMIFAMIGSMNAMQNTFKESVESSLTQIIGMIYGAILGVLLMTLPIHPLICVGIGVVCVIIMYNVFQVDFSPVLPSMMVLSICTATDMAPVLHAAGRLWDTTIGLTVGMLINVLIFPFDNSLKIRQTIEYLEKEVLCFLEEMFDGSKEYPDTQKMREAIDDIGSQLGIYSKQWLPFSGKYNKKLEIFEECENKSRELLAQMEVLHQMKNPGRLDAELRQRLMEEGAEIKERSVITRFDEADIITNYHVEQILKLRRELMETIGQISNKKNK